MIGQSIYSRNRVQWLYELARCVAVGPAAVRVGLLFGTFFQETDERETLNPSYDWIMQQTGLSRATVAKALRELEEHGFLDITRYSQMRNRYSFPFDGESAWKRRV